MDLQGLERLCRQSGFSAVTALLDHLQRVAAQLTKGNSLRWLYSEADLAQDTWVRLIENDHRVLARVADTRCPAAYLRRIMANRLCDVARELSRARQTHRAVDCEPRVVLAPSLTGRDPSRAVAEVVTTYVDTQCDVVDRAVFSGLVVEERAARLVAAELGLSENAIYVRKHRLLQRLRAVALKARSAR